MRIGFSYWLLAMLGAFFAWANYTYIDQNVRAQGKVIPKDRTQIIQVADGGVLERLFVAEGEQVKAGDVLATLERSRVEAGVEDVRAQITNSRVARIRAYAEAESIQPDFTTYAETHPSLVLAQQALYDQNQRELSDEVNSLRDSLALAQEELEILEMLLTTGDVSKLDVVRVRRQVVDLKGQINAAQNRVVTEARAEIANIEEELARQQHRLEEQLSRLRHTSIEAPLDGVIKYLRVNTLGGVLRGGDELMQISPTDGGYIIEANVMPADIGTLELGLPVSVRLDAFDYSIYGALSGTLTHISSDTLSENDGESTLTYYRINVMLDEAQDNPKLSAEVLKPGMTAMVDVLTGKRTLLEFLIKPISRSFSGALTQR